MAENRTLDVFLGVNEAVYDTQTKFGEASSMKNCRITDNFKLEQIEGYAELFSSLAAKPIRGQWYGSVGGAYHYVFACNSKLYRREYIMGTEFASIDTSSYTNIDVVKTTALGASEAGTTGIDGIIRWIDSEGAELTEIAQSSIDLVASVGKFYYHTDKTVWLVVEKGMYASIAAARTGLGECTTFFPFGSVADAPVFMFALNSKLYIMDGTEYRYWNGTTLATVSGYIPTVYTATPPAGGGTELEGINLLTGWKKQEFSGDGTSTNYYIVEQDIDDDDVIAIVNGVTLVEDTGFTVDRTNGVITFSVAPSSGTNNVSTQWNKASASNRAEITSCRKAVLFGSRVHVFGGTDANKKYFSGLEGISPVITAEYFPALNVSNIGSDEFAITDVVNHNENYQIIFTNGRKSFYSYYTTITDANDNTIVSFPVFDLNDSIGHVAFGQAQVINDNVYTIQEGVNRWITTTVSSQRNAPYISARVQPSLDEIDLSDVLTCDFPHLNELWIALDKIVIVYNYKNDLWYKFELLHNITSMLYMDKTMYFGTDDGRIMRFDDSLKNFNGAAISAEWEMGYYAWDADWLRKFMGYTWFSVKPDFRVNLDVYWITDRDTVEKQSSLSLQYNLMDYEQIDYDAWTYETSLSPKPKRIKTKAKKFTYIRFVLRNDVLNYTFHLLSINMLARIGGTSK